MQYNTDDLKIRQIRELLPPIALLERFPLSAQVSTVVAESRASIEKILAGQDDRLFVVVGPCSIHDVEAAMEYATKLNGARKQYIDSLEIVMRVYFEKPRTTVGWKGLINDPRLDGSCDINHGLRLARKLLLEINCLGLPTAGEFLDTITPQYTADLMSWGAIGARTTESNCHRQLASGLSCPVGFKNGTDGNVKIAIDAISAAASRHSFLSVTKFGHAAIVETQGNSECHIILRGGQKPNYTREHIELALDQLQRAGAPAKLMVDFSHANSNKEPLRQLQVCGDICQQLEDGSQAIFGVMVESNLVGGAQSLTAGQTLNYGQSITDGCIDWEQTEAVLAGLAQAVVRRRSAVQRS